MSDAFIIVWTYSPVWVPLLTAFLFAMGRKVKTELYDRPDVPDHKENQ